MESGFDIDVGTYMKDYKYPFVMCIIKEFPNEFTTLTVECKKPKQPIPIILQHFNITFK